MNRIKIFFKGMLMGACDVIPGISGGTIAFITGIYERFINSIKGFSMRLVVGLMLFVFGKVSKERVKRDLQKLDIEFLAPLIAGILTAIFLLANLMSFLLENYFALTISFFVGLIIASAFTVFEHIERHHTLNGLFAVAGLLIGVSLIFIVPINVEPTLLYVFFSGFLAVSAMILPGVSGSFILLILGIYEFMLNVVKNFFSNFKISLVFVFGAILGLFGMTRLISYLLKADKSKTLYFLLGIVVGSLSVPVRGIYNAGFGSNSEIVFSVVLFALGILSARMITEFSRRRY